MKEKVGILTFHRASNYGAVLQTYALQTACEKLGADVEIIDYRCPTVENAHNPWNFAWSHTIKHIIRVPGKCIKFIEFERFRNKWLKLSKKADAKNIKEIEEKYSVLIAGSDQLWNEKFSGMDEQYFMPNDVSAQKITYAISTGDMYDEDAVRMNLKKHSKTFAMISLREERTKSFITTITSTPCRVDVDPTLLLNSKDWLKIARKPDVDKPYVLIYTVAEPESLINKAKEYSDMMGYELFYLNSGFSKYRDIKRIRYSTPEEFVGLFSEAAFVFTNSFHGTVFSILFNKQFAIEDHSSRGKHFRILSLLERLNIGDRSIDRFGSISEMEICINWQEVNSLLKDYSCESKRYLKKYIGEENDRCHDQK